MLFARIAAWSSFASPTIPSFAISVVPPMFTLSVVATSLTIVPSSCQPAALEQLAQLPSNVRFPVMVTLPLKREAPSTPSVVLGLAVPIPTRSSLAFTTSVVVSTTRLAALVVEATASPPERLVSTVSTFVPERWIASAVSEAIFIKSPPAPVKPERNVPLEFCSSKRFAFWVECARTPSWISSESPITPRRAISSVAEPMVRSSPTVVRYANAPPSVKRLSPPPPPPQPVQEPDTTRLPTLNVLGTIVPFAIAL